MPSPVEGFWLPQNLRSASLSEQAETSALSFHDGRPCDPQEEGAITAWWPRLSPAHWHMLLHRLHENRQRAPAGAELASRLQAALRHAAGRLSNPADPLHRQALETIPGYTGYSPAMIRFALDAFDLFDLEQFTAALAYKPSRNILRDWQPYGKLPGYARFYPSNQLHRLAGRWPLALDAPLYNPAHPPQTIVGYGAGNVPGTALLIAFLALATALGGASPPVVLIKNSRREPVFSPLVLSAIEQADPELVSTVAVLVWDYEDHAIQDTLLPQSDLVIAAASDETLASLERQLRAAAPHAAHSIRFHAHGHKVSFSAISRQSLAHDLRDPASGQALLDIVALLAALDSVFWDQNGCLSSRIHFVEQAGVGFHTPQDYAQRLQKQLEFLSRYLPRGAWPRSSLHNAFDRYKGLEPGGAVQVFSSYDDEFLLVLDRRDWTPAIFRSLLNDCQGRVIFIRPVQSLLEVPHHYLNMLPSANLQSLSLAAGDPLQPLPAGFFQFASACAACGVTALRTVGRGAFPQLAYSWDGFLPLDLLCHRPPGHFTTLEFTRPFEQICATYNQLIRSWPANSA